MRSPDEPAGRSIEVIARLAMADVALGLGEADVTEIEATYEWLAPQIRKMLDVDTTGVDPATAFRAGVPPE
jgi:hypothetical protein